MTKKNRLENEGRNAVIADLESYNWTIVNKSSNSAQDVLLAIKGKEKLVVLISTIVDKLFSNAETVSYRRLMQAKSFRGGTIMYEAKVHLDKMLKKQKIEFVKMSL
ncbi:MAG: hypothetical protein JEY97_11400 [Bacteroidales bacterium]|nr:hypothetical protein [Bacteroidales bacterium]